MKFFKREPLVLPPIPPIYVGELNYWGTGVTKAQAIDTLHKARRRMWRGGFFKFGCQYICFAVDRAASNRRVAEELRHVISEGLGYHITYEGWLMMARPQSFTRREIQAGRLAWIDAIIKELS